MLNIYKGSPQGSILRPINAMCLAGAVANMCLAGAVANVADSDRCRCNPKVPSSIPAGGKDFP